MNKDKEIMAESRSDSSQQGLPPVKEGSSGTFPIRDPESYRPLGELQTITRTEKRATRRSAPSVVRFQTELQETPATPEFEQMKFRRMSDPGGLLTQFLAAEADVLDEESKSSTVNQATDEAEQSDWGTFVEAPLWEDWQDFATHGAFTSPVDLDTEEEATKRLQILSPYIPQTLTHTALYDPNVPLGESPSIQCVTGAIMIADITGFTTLTERALTSKRGNELVEELTGCMNNYFDEAIELVIEHGGDTIKFAGDSIIVCFPVHEESNEGFSCLQSQASCALRAVACGFDLISSLGAYTPELGGYGNTTFESTIHDDKDLKDSKPRRSLLSRSLSSRGLRDKKGSEKVVHILIVDDIMLNCVVLSKMLSKLNCEVVLAANGREAVKAHSKQSFDAIFMDVHMPVLDGIRATHIIRRSGRSKTPIVGVSSKVDDQLRKECIAAGMDDLLSKPLTMSQLVTVLRTLRASRTNREPDQIPSRDTSPLVNDRSQRKYSGAQIDSKAASSGSPLNHHGVPWDASPTHRKSRHKSSKGDSILRAILQRSSSTDAVPDASLTLALKVLIGAGKVSMLSVGGGLQMPSGLPRWEFFMADMPVPIGSEPKHFRQPMEQLRCCEEHANSGNVILSPEVWSLVENRCEGELLEDGFVRLSHIVGHVSTPPPPQDSYDIKRVPMAVHILKRYLPELLRSKIEATPATDSRVRAEVRHVTCLYLGLPSLSSKDISESVLLDNTQKAMLTVQQSLRLFDGLLIQFRMDEKGYVMICAFGLPGNLHEDDPKRGVQTALDVLEKFGALRQKVDIGVTTGKLLCTVIGGKRRCEYTVFGNCINLSARLMKKANNEVLIDMDTYRMTSDVLEAVELPPMSVKGRTGLLKVYRVVCFKAAVTPANKSSRSKSLVSPIASPKEFEDILCSTIFGRKAEMDAAIAKIDTFLSRQSELEGEKFSVVEDESVSVNEVEDSGGGTNIDKIFHGATTSQAPRTSSDQPKTTTEDVSCTAIVLTGHAGIGKSKVLESLTCYLKDLPVQILLTGSEMKNNNILVFGPWVKLLLDLLCFDPDYSPAERGAVVLKHLDTESHQHAHLLKDILKIKIKDQAIRRSPRPSRKVKIFRRSISAHPSTSLDSSDHLRGDQARKISFISQLAAQGASILARKISKEDPQEPGDPLEPSPTYITHISVQGDSPLSRGDPNQEHPLQARYSEPSSTSTSVSETQEYINIVNSNPDEEPLKLNAQSEPFLTSLESVSEVDPNRTQSLETEPAQIEHPSTSESATSENQRSVISSHDPELNSQSWKRHSIDHGQLLRRASKEFGSGQEVTPRRPSINQRRTSLESDKEGIVIASPEISMQRVAKMIKQLILALVKRPCIIFIEDAHLMDNPSWSIMKEISEEKDSGILTIVACRPWGAHAPKDYTSLAQSKSTLVITLRELDELSTRAFIRQKISEALGGNTDISPQIFQAIYRRTQGHPLFSEQMAVTLVAMKIITPGNSEDTLKRLGRFELEKFNFSYSMEALIASRVDLLEPNQALTLKVASVIGLNFSEDLLLSVLNQQLQRETTPSFTKQQLQAALKGLDKLNFLNLHTNRPGAYSFSNSVTRDTTYEMLPVKQRRMIHADIAKELVKLGTSGARTVQIARHYTLACKDVEELEVDLTAIAIDHWEEAASSALFKFGEYELAIEYYLYAISLGNAVLDHINRQRLASWHHFLSTAYAAVGDIDSSAQNTILALKYTGENISEDLALHQEHIVCCSAVFEPGIWAWKIYCQKGLLSWLLYLTRNGNDSQDSILRCEALAQLATLAICKEELHSAKKLSARYLVVSQEESSSHPLEVPRAYSLAALVTSSPFLRKYRCLKCMEGLRLQERIKYQAVQAGDIHYNLAVICLFQGRWNKAQKHASKALKVYEASQGRREVDLCRCLIALGQLYQGQYENCHQEGARLLTYRQEHPQLRIWAIFLVVSSLNSMKRYQDSAKAIAQLEDGPCSIPSLALQVKALGWEASLCLDRETGLQDAFDLIPQLMSLTPLTAIFPKALASAAEVVLTTLELHKMSDLQRVAREEVMELLLKCMKTAAKRIGITYFYYKFFNARLAWTRGHFHVAEVLFKQAMKYSLGVKMLPAATAANAWLAKCKAPGLPSEPPV